MKKTACKGPNYKYLGHFAQQKWLDKGHNDVGVQSSGGLMNAPPPAAIAPVAPPAPPPALAEYEERTVGGGGMRGRSIVRDPITAQPRQDPAWVQSSKALNDASRPTVGPRRRG